MYSVKIIMVIRLKNEFNEPAHPFMFDSIECVVQGFCRVKAFFRANICTIKELIGLLAQWWEV